MLLILIYRLGTETEVIYMNNANQFRANTKDVELREVIHFQLLK